MRVRSRSNQTMPSQETGVRPARAVTYTLHRAYRDDAKGQVRYWYAVRVVGGWRKRESHRLRSWCLSPSADLWNISNDVDRGPHFPSCARAVTEARTFVWVTRTRARKS